MQNMYRQLRFLSVLVILTTFIGSLALAAEVTKVNAHKGHVYIDQGKDAGFVMGSEVCIFSEQGEKITCGQVRQTLSNRAMVRVTKRLAQKVEKGMTAKLAVSKTSEKSD